MTNRVKAVGTFDDKISGPLDRVRDKFDRLQKQGAKGFAIGAGAAITAKGFSLLDSAASGAIDAIGDSIAAASDLNETVSKTRTIFGDGSDEIEAWGATASKAFGQTKQQALDAASGFAGLFSTVGIELDKSAGMATKLTELGSDLASFFNTDVATALGALKSGLSGESEPLRAFNVFLSETAVTAKLAEMGIKKVGGQFTEAQKATARYALILEQTTTAQGDFDRTADGLANTQKTLTAQLADLSAEIGQELLPVVKDLAIFARDDLVPALKGVVEVGKGVGGVIDFMGDAATNFIDPLARVKDNLTEEALAAAKARKETDDAVGAFREGERQTGATSHATDVLAGSLEDVADEMADAEDIARDLNDALGDLAGEMYDGAITAGELAEAQQKLADLLNEGADATRPGDWTIYQGELAEARKEVFLLQAEMAKQAGPEAFYDWLIKQRGALGDTDAETRTLIDSMLVLAATAARAAQVSAFAGGGGGFRSGPGLDAFASGGHWSGRKPAIVGEEGPEILIPDGVGATVIPNDAVNGVDAWMPSGNSNGDSFGGGGSPAERTQVIQLVVDGRVLAEAVNRESYYRQSGPSRYPRG